jgi:hypothetical protein
LPPAAKVARCGRAAAVMLMLPLFAFLLARQAGQGYFLAALFSGMVLAVGYRLVKWWVRAYRAAEAQVYR